MSLAPTHPLPRPSPSAALITGELKWRLRDPGVVPVVADIITVKAVDARRMTLIAQIVFLDQTVETGSGRQGKQRRHKTQI